MYTLIMNDEADPATITPVIEALSLESQEPRHITVLPKTDQHHAGTSRSGLNPRTMILEKTGTDSYTGDGTLCELADAAMLQAESLITAGYFKRAIIGISGKDALGLETLSRGATALAVHIAITYGIPTYAFCAAGKHPSKLTLLTRDILRDEVNPGQVLVACFPPGEHRAWGNANPAHYQPRAKPPTSIIPRAKDDGSDADLFTQGRTTITRLDPRIAPLLRF